MAKFDSSIDFYLRHPIPVDIILMLFTIGCNYYAPTFITINYHLDSQLSILSNLIGTGVSMAGFILAALTIIVTFKSNISSRTANEANNPLELLFSTKHYENIVRIFKHSIIELTFSFLILYFIWLFSGSTNTDYLFYSNLYGILFIGLSLFRSLFILFWVLRLQRHTDDN